MEGAEERRRQVGRAEMDYDPLLRAVAEELGTTVEALLGCAQDMGLRVLQWAASSRAAAGKTPLWRVARLASRAEAFRLPQLSGELVRVSSLLAMKGGFVALRLLRRLLEAGR